MGQWSLAHVSSSLARTDCRQEGLLYERYLVQRRRERDVMYVLLTFYSCVCRVCVYVSYFPRCLGGAG